MRVPTRKPGIYAGQKPDPHITQEKYDELVAKLERLKRSRPKVIEEVKFQAAMGDFSENAAYGIAKGRLRGINQRMLEIEDHLKRSIIIKAASKDKVSLGCTVTIETGGKQKAYTILGSSEVDPLHGIISHNSPIGSALMGRKIGDYAEVILKDKTNRYKIISIR